jgi:uncharacterized protein YlxW (UPF0749 family)
MTLLIETMRRPLDPGYAAAAAQRAERGAPGERRRAPLTLALALVGGLVLLTSITALRLPGSADAGERLREQVRSRTTAVDAAEERVVALRAEIATLQGAQLSTREGGLADQARTLGVLAGTERVTGPGVVHVLDDAPVLDDPVGGEAPVGQTPQSGRVLARDLQVVVNGLWGAGAEAVSVNGHRLTATAAIRQAGDAVIVDFRPLARPYTVEAIGNPNTLQTGFARSTAGAYLSQVEQNYGVLADVSAEDSLTLAGGGNLALRHAAPLEPAAPPATVPGSADTAPIEEDDTP